MDSNHHLRKLLLEAWALTIEPLAQVGGTGSSRRSDLRVRNPVLSYLSYSPVVAKQRQVRKPSTDRAPRTRTHADRCRLPKVRRVRLTNESVRDACSNKTISDHNELELTRNGERDRVRVFGKVSFGGLAGSVDDLRSEKAERKVSANDHVVSGYVLRNHVGGELTVNASTWFGG